MKVASAPGRVNLIGEHTDYNLGLALPFAIDRRVTVSFEADESSLLRLRSEGHEPVTVSLDELTPGTTSGWAGYVAGAAWALQRNGISVAGGSVSVVSDLPAGAGLSSSAALCSAAVLALMGREIPAMEVALLAHAAEAEFAMVPCGMLDQIAVCCATPGSAVLVDARFETATPVAMNLAEQGLALLLIDSGVRHSVRGGGYAERRLWCVQAAARLGVPDLSSVTDIDAALVTLADEPHLAAVVRHVFTENERVRAVTELLRSGRTGEIGPLLTASHRSLQQDYQVSCPELDSAVDGALAAGALGARMTGAGFGGSAIALVRAELSLPGAVRLGPPVGGARLVSNLFG